jgi:hypothetical protein
MATTSDGDYVAKRRALERLMRDHRINLIGEGANDVLRAFAALVGMRDVGLELKGVPDALMNPFRHLRGAGSGIRIRSAIRRRGRWL